uniref:Myb-like domain-containing protein n=1 Tax=Oryza brachyantha TaxID=4533 RepID=J3LQR0_ORYBR
MCLSFLLDCKLTFGHGFFFGEMIIVLLVGLCYLQNSSSATLPRQPAMSQNAQFTTGLTNFSPFRTPRGSMDSEIPPQPQAEQSTPRSPTGLHTQTSINIESEEEEWDDRTNRRTRDEDERLMSAWLNNSNDPIHGNNKKNDQCWGDIIDVYNSTTKKSRRRIGKQAKVHWWRVFATPHL